MERLSYRVEKSVPNRRCVEKTEQPGTQSTANETKVPAEVVRVVASAEKPEVEERNVVTYQAHQTKYAKPDSRPTTGH